MIAGIQVIFLSLYFYKFPVFHSTLSIDPVYHVSLVGRILEGRGKQMLSSASYPLGLHFFLSVFTKGLGGELLIALRYGVAFVEVLKTLLVYSVVRRTTNNDQRAVYTSAAYSLILTPGLFHLAGSGTYTNLYGDFVTLIVLYFIALFLKRSMNVRVSVSLMFMGAALTFSHYSVFLFFTFSWIFAVPVFLLWKDQFRKYVFSTVMISLPFLSILALFSQLIPHLLRILFSEIRPPFSITPVDSFFNFLESYLPRLIVFGHVYNYVQPLNFIIVLASCAIAIKRRMEFWSLFALGWFLYSCFFSISGFNVWRFALYALNPASLLVGFFLSEVLTEYSKRVSKLSTSNLVNKVNAKSIPFIVVLLLVTFGPMFTFTRSWVSNVELIRAKQLYVYESMKWAEENTETEASFISIMLQEYRYLPDIGHRMFYGVYGTNIQDVVSSHQIEPFDYVVVWIPDGLQEYWSSEYFEKAYENKQVAIFRYLRTN
jgi:hypothetical protein